MCYIRLYIWEIDILATPHARTGLEGPVARTVACASQIVGPQRSIAAPIVIKGGRVIHGRPGEAGVNIDDPTQRPATGYLLHSILDAVEQYRLPHPKNFEGLANIEIGTPTSVFRVVWIRV